MGDWLAQLRQHLRPSLEMDNKGLSEIRFAFLGYRDVDDRRRFERLNFPSSGTTASNPSELWRGFIASITPGGGDDKAEDVLGGLREALSLSWTAELRLLIHIADGPSHGLFYHAADIEDKYTGFDFDGAIGKNLVETLHDRGIDYCFLDTSAAPSCNAKMIEKFTGWYSAKAKLSDQRTRHQMTVRSNVSPQSLSDIVHEEVTRIFQARNPPVADHRFVTAPVVLAPVRHQHRKKDHKHTHKHKHKHDQKETKKKEKKKEKRAPRLPEAPASSDQPTSDPGQEQSPAKPTTPGRPPIMPPRPNYKPS